MGIEGLFTCLRLKKTTIEDLKLTSVAVDASHWVYKCVEYHPEFVINQDLDVILRYIREFIQMLKNHRVVVYMVFDGTSPPIRQQCSKNRAEERNKNYREYQKSANLMDLQGAFKLTSALTAKLVKELKRERVKCYVAIYEADAQLAYLAKKGEVDAVITNDTDIIVYGVERVLFDLESSGSCREFNRSGLYRMQKNKISFDQFNHRMFTETCVLSGCDYVKSCGKLKIICDRIRRHKSWNKVLDKHGCEVGYRREVEKALLAYQYYLVYDISEMKMVHFNEVEERHKTINMDFLGSLLDNKTAKGIAEGRIDPVSKLLYSKCEVDEKNKADAVKVEEIDNALEEVEAAGGTDFVDVVDKVEEIDNVEEVEAAGGTEVVDVVDKVEKIDNVEEVEAAGGIEDVDVVNGDGLPKKERREVNFPIFWHFRLFMRAIYSRVCRY